MAARGEQRGAASVLPRVPAELPIPRPDAVIVIDLAIMQFAEQSLIDDGLRREKLAGETALETDARLHARGIDRAFMATQSFHESASGFSMMMCLPAFAAAMTCAVC